MELFLLTIMLMSNPHTMYCTSPPTPEHTKSFTELLPPPPSQGMKFLVEKGLVNSTAEDVALFLFVSQLDKKAIGDYLGEG